MIVPMKKVALLVQAKDAQGALVALRRLGLVHIEHARTPAGRDIQALADEIALLDNAMAVLQSVRRKEDCLRSAARIPADWRIALHHVIDCRNRIEQLGEYQRVLKGRLAEWEAWGAFEPAAIDELAGAGVFVRLYQIPAKELTRLPAGVVAQPLFRAGGIVSCAVIARTRIDLPFKEVMPPKMSCATMRAKLAEDAQAIEALRAAIREAVCYYDAFVLMKRRLEAERVFSEALTGMGQAGELAYLRGYVPADALAGLAATAARERWGFLAADPGPDDLVPTLIRNPAWVSLISPVFKMIEVVPGYAELDISLWFLIFFSIFFGMLIGDAGIGAIFLCLTIVAYRRFGRKAADPAPFLLFAILSGAAIVWGILSATYFGQAWLPAAVRPLVPALRDDRAVQEICFLLGALHLSVAHLWRAILKAPSLTALVDIGWLSVIWGMFFLARNLILAEPLPVFTKYFFILGPLLVIPFTEPQRNIPKALGAGIGNFLLNFVNNFTDVVSYIRLFAVGLATVAVADAFNQMASGIGFGSFFTGLAAACILVVGHGLNIVLGPLSVLVHGVRLNVLEFCMHADIKWSGFAYNPLREEGAR